MTVLSPAAPQSALETQAQVAAKIRRYIRDSFLFGSEQKLKDEDSLLDAGVIDSTGAMELVSFLETEFCVEVTDQDLVPENLDSVAAMTAFVERKLASVGSAA